jgi:DNA-binding XRE family transcriptional regulator
MTAIGKVIVYRTGDASPLRWPCAPLAHDRVDLAPGTLSSKSRKWLGSSLKSKTCSTWTEPSRPDASLHVSQQQPAAASGVRQSEISRIESGHGNPTLKTIGSLTRAMGAELRIASS